MTTRALGRSGPAVSAMGLGCMGMSDFYRSKDARDDAESIRTIHAALEAGITLLDTGDFYGLGHNEALIARALAGRRERALISVKFGALRSPSGAFLGLGTRPALVKTFAAYSLQRLGVEAIDIYQPTRVDPSVPVEETVGAVADLIREGKVRYLGMSEASAENLRRAHATHPVTALQIEYSIATRMIEREILPLARSLGIGVVAYGALSRGLLGGALSGPFTPGDFRAHAPRFNAENLPHNLKQVALLNSMAQKKGCTCAQLAIAWVLSQGNDIVPIVGTTRRDRLSENLKALDVTLGAEELGEIARAFPPGSFSGERYPQEQMRIVAG
ncbi:MAG TPA: aldo/keto reductase [Bacteroidota bacterium]|nr:aldo/keto reductase [Bacteroidota bacterium]